MNPLQEFPGLAAVHLEARPVHLAIGMFDGVHLGHRAVIEAAVQSAREHGGVSAVLTFWPHPSRLFKPHEATRLIMPPAAKALALARLGVEVVIEQEFTREFAAIPAEEFLPYLQQSLLGLATVCVGENWRFGRGRTGDARLLVREARRLGVSIFSAPRVNFDGEPISSTWIRTLLSEGAIEQANRLLGYAYFAVGRIAAGKGLGRQIGFPTLNLEWAPELAPHHGVYAVRVNGPKGVVGLPAVANYGLRPTVENARVPRLEVHLLGDCPWKTGDELTVEWKHFLRPERKFERIEDLRAQIGRDCAAAAGWLGEKKP